MNIMAKLITITLTSHIHACHVAPPFYEMGISHESVSMQPREGEGIHPPAPQGAPPPEVTSLFHISP